MGTCTQKKGVVQLFQDSQTVRPSDPSELVEEFLQLCQFCIVHWSGLCGFHVTEELILEILSE